MTFSPVERKTLAQRVAEEIRGSIIDGHYGAGEALPAERELAKQFDINRSSVREALLRLEAWGLIKISQGEPTRVLDWLNGAGLQLLPYLLMPKGQLDVALLADLLSVRVMFLRWVGQQAALRSAKKPQPKLRALVDALATTTSAKEAQELDWQFYQQLVALTQNRVMRILTNVLHSIYQRAPASVELLYQTLPFDISEHQRALDAIEQSDAQTAADAMEAYGLRALGGSYAK